MSKATPERRLVVRLLREQRVRGARARDLLRASEELSALPARDRGFVTSLVLGVVRTSGALDAVLASHLRAGGHLEPRVRDALRLAAYELLYEGTEPRVAVSQGVELVRLASPRAAGLANAVLRHVAVEDVPRVDAARSRVAEGSCSREDFALAGGLPRWLVAQMDDSLGDGGLARLVGSLDAAPPVYVAANAARHDTAATTALLKRAGIEAESVDEARLPGAFRLSGGGELARSGLVASCDVVPCDLAAQLVVQVAAPKPGGRVLEVGQGRGTKSILLENAALAAGGPCDVEAIDSEEFKVDVARRRMVRAGLSAHVRSRAFDGLRLAGTREELPKALRGPFDLVFVDAPCSGTGTMRRHPEIPWSLSSSSVLADGELPRLQLGLLAAAAARVAPGGTLVYATCSVLREENESVVSDFLATDLGKGFALECTLRTTDCSPDCDGHFCARMVRRG